MKPLTTLTTRLDLIYRRCGLSSAISKEGYEQRLMLSSRDQISEVSSIRLPSIRFAHLLANGGNGAMELAIFINMFATQRI
jgi:hypothetical protein